MSVKNISTEDLLKALASDTPTEIASLSPVMEFIERFALSSGDYKVHQNILYELFLKHYPMTHSIVEFNKQASLLLNISYQHYHLNKDNVLILHEIIKKPVKEKKRRGISLPTEEAMQRHMDAFIAKYSIESGKIGVPWFVLYKVYCDYCVDIKFRHPKKTKIFINYLSCHLRFVMNDYGPVFIINIAANTLPNKGEYANLKKTYQAI